MNDQQELPFDARKLARTDNPETSKAAARQSKELRTRHHRIIIEVMGRGGSWTCDEIAAACVEMDRVQVGKLGVQDARAARVSLTIRIAWRMHEIERAGLVRKTGDARPTASGRMANCYEVCDTIGGGA